MFRNFFKNKSLVTLVAGLVCVAIVVYFYHYRVNKIIDTIPVPVAVKRLDGRHKIESSDIKTIKVARSLLSNNVITNTQNIEGKYVDYNTYIPENGLFYTEAIVEWSEMPDSTWSDIETGKTIIYLDIEEGKSYGNAIYPNDRIDLYIRAEDEANDLLVYGKFIEGIKVLAVKDANGNHIFDKRPATSRPAQLIFEVDEEMFLLLKSAIFLNNKFEIVPVPRNSKYTSETSETLYGHEWFRDEIYKWSTMLKPDLIDEENTNIDIPVTE